MAKPRLTSLKPRISQIETLRGAPAVKRIVGRELQRIRDRILLRDEYTCQDCGRVTVDGEVDHVVPLHLGGAESDFNRAYICKECHILKTKKEEKERGNKY